jgi:hypothetical protein
MSNKTVVQISYIPVQLRLLSNAGNSSLFVTESINLWPSERILLPPACINSARILPVRCDLHFFQIFHIHLNLSSGSAVCISVCLTSLTPCTFNS